MSNKSPPPCFKEFWDEKHVECRGGLDPLYSDPETSTSVRPKCSWYDACRPAQGDQLIPHNTLFRFPSPPTTPQATPQPVPQMTPQVQPQPMQVPPVQVPSYMNALRSVAAQVAAAPQVPVRPPIQPTVQTYYAQPQPQYQQPAPQPQQYHQPQQQPQYHPQPQFAQGMVPPYMAAMPGMVPMNYVMPGTQMPSFLTVPEPIIPGQHWGQRLAFTLLRGMVKALGMTLANFFDHTTVNPWQPPQPPPPSG